MGEPSLDDSNVKVAVRVRPMNRRGEGASLLCWFVVTHRLTLHYLRLPTNKLHVTTLFTADSPDLSTPSLISWEWVDSQKSAPISEMS